MSYSAPLSERIRIQFEIYYENIIDGITSISKNYKRHVVACVIVVMVLGTLRSSRRNINNVKTMGYSYGSGSDGYNSSNNYGGGYYSGGASKKSGGIFSKLFGGRKKQSNYGNNNIGGYGSSGSMLSYGNGGGGGGSSMSSSYGAGGLGSSSMYGGGVGLRGGTNSMNSGSSSYASSLLGNGGGGGMGGTTATSSFGGIGGGMSGIGGGMVAGAGQKSPLATLIDSNPTSILVVLDPSIHFYDYGGTSTFYGQIETIQAYDSPNFITQVINLPGQNKVLVIDGGGTRSDMHAIFDYDMASTAMRNGWRGVIVYGFVRHVMQLQRLSNFGVKALGTCPIKGKGDVVVGQKGIELSVGNTQIQSGWWVYADEDGVAFSQVDISGGSFGGGGGGGVAAMGGGMGGAGGVGSSMIMSGGFGGGMNGGVSGGAGGFGSSSSMGSSFSSGGGLAGGTGLNGGYGNTATGSAYGGGMMGASGGGGGFGGGYGSASSGGLSSYGSSGSSGMGGTSQHLTGGYGSASSYGAGGGTSSSSLYSGYGSQYPYGSSSYSKKKKHKTFKLMLAAAIAAIIWIVCLR